MTYLLKIAEHSLHGLSAIAEPLVSLPESVTTHAGDRFSSVWRSFDHVTTVSGRTPVQQPVTLYTIIQNHTWTANLIRFTIPEQVHHTWTGTPYLNNIPEQVHHTWTAYLNRYTIPEQLHHNWTSTPYLNRYTIPEWVKQAYLNSCTIAKQVCHTP